jgi:hypothetical protein
MCPSSIRDYSSKNVTFIHKGMNPVTFLKRVKRARTLSLNEYTEEEIKETWFTRQEYENIKNDCLRQVEHLVDSEQFGLTTIDSTTRGLENRTKLGLSRKLVNRQTSIDAVLDEQFKQEALGMRNEIHISKVYNQVSAKCQIYANFMGQCDAYDARHAYDEVCAWQIPPTTNNEKWDILLPPKRASSKFRTKIASHSLHDKDILSSRAA